MSANISARLNLTHAATCPVPGYIAALPFATMMGRNPWIGLVGDGKGGELFRCNGCGALEGSGPPPPRIARVPGHPTPADGLDREQTQTPSSDRIELDRDAIIAAWAASVDAGESGSKRLTARRLNVSESTLDRRWRDLHGGDSPGWPPG